MLDHLRLTVRDVAEAYRLYDPGAALPRLRGGRAAAPGLHHVDYEPGYSATFFRDPNGFKLEVMNRP